MPTNDERREVAAMLRDLSVATGVSWPRLMGAMGVQTRGGAVARLADLIEPRTCRDVYDGREFRCSACGSMSHVLERDEAWEWRFVGAPRFCPHCGAEVVADA